MTKKVNGLNKEFDELWEKGEKVKVKKAAPSERMPVFSMKIDPRLLETLVEHARGIGVPPSTLARSLIEEGLLKRGERLSADNLADLLRTRLKETEVYS